MMTPTDVIDHVVEIKNDPSLELSWDNLMALCHRNHNVKNSESKRKIKQIAPLSNDIFK